MKSSKLILLIILGLIIVRPGITESNYSADSESKAESPVEISGSLSAQYQGQFHGDDDDNNLTESLYLNIDGLLDGMISAAMGLRFYQNLDNYQTYQDNSTYYVYEGIWDAYSQRNREQLYYGYIDIKDLIGSSILRLGRQYLYQANFVHFDGAKFRWEDFNGFDIELFGGYPVSYYSSTDGDYTYGGGFAWHPNRYGSIGLDYLKFHEENYDDDYFRFYAKEYAGDHFQLYENYNILNSESKDMQIQGIYIQPDIGLNINATYYHQFITMEDYSNQFSPYYQAIGDYYPFYLFSLYAYKECGPHLALNAGFSYRDLEDSSDQSDFNRQYELYYAGLTLRDIALKNLDFSVTAQRWKTDSYSTSSIASLNSNPNDTTNTLPDEVEVFYDVPGDKTDSWSAEIAYKWNKRNKIQLGTDFQKYKYNYDTNQENKDVRTIYLKWRMRFWENWEFYTRFEQEKQSDDPDEFYKLITTLIYNFQAGNDDKK